MLYVTTRGRQDVFTAYHALRDDRSPDGGFYIPFQKIRFTREQILALREKSFNQCVADILNLFFTARLDALDIDFCVGRYPVRLVPMSHKIMVAETWNNPEWDFSRMVRNLSGRILGEKDTGRPSNWTYIAVRIAVLFGIFAELQRFGIADADRPIDISVVSGDFSSPVAVWYARQMGLPIGTIIFSCEESSCVWDLLHHGQISTGLGANNRIPENLERFLSSALGTDENIRYVDTVSARSVFSLAEEQRETLSTGVFSAVVSPKRIYRVISNVYRTSTYILHPNSAQAYGGLQDYRATEVEAGPALILTEQGPHCAIDTVAEAIGISPWDLKERINTL